MRRLKFRSRILPLLLVTLLVSYLGIVFVNPPSSRVSPRVTLAAERPAETVALSWPSTGQAAVGALGYNLLESNNGAATPVPTASTIKVMTAYAVLRAKPLILGQQAEPAIPIAQADVDLYNAYIAKDGSVARVAAGTELSEYQALQALLLPSANNIADTLVRWAFGSEANYIAYANGLAQELGLTSTKIADASGFSPLTVSTAVDMVKLSTAAMKNPVFAQIVGQQTAIIPVAGQLYNTNYLIGRENIIGVKTGNTDEAGGCFIGAATHVVDGKTITLVTAVLGSPNKQRAMADTVPLLQSAKQNFVSKTPILKGTEVGYYQTAWGGKTAVVAEEDVTFVGWKGSKTTLETNLKPLRAPQKQGASAGTIQLTSDGFSSQISAELSEQIIAPSIFWRLRHPF